MEINMKNKVLVILFALLTTLFILTLSINASDACNHESKEVLSVEYTDYAQKGKIKFECPGCDVTEKEIKPLLTLKGYSISNDGGSLCTGYTINSEALSEITKLNGNFEIGMVAAAKSFLGDKMPLDSKTGEPVDLSQYGASVIKANITNGNYATVDLKLDGFNQLSAFEQLYMSAYAYDGENVKYIQEKTKDTLSKISYVMIQSPEDVVINGNSFSVFEPSTTVAPHRQGQMDYSASDYNSGSTYTKDELNSVVSGTNAITNFFTGLVFPNASAFMKHYLGKTGAEYTINMGTGSKGFFKSNETKAHRVTRITEAMRAAEQLAKEGGSIDIYQKTEQVNHFSDHKQDWYLAVGSYFTCIEMNNVTVTVGENGVKTYSASVKYTVTDFYNWDEGKTWAVNSYLDISEKDLHNLHKAGMAREFCSRGTATYQITWTEGQTADQISGIN